MATITGQLRLHAHRYIGYSVSFSSRLNQDYVVPVPVAPELPFVVQSSCTSVRTPVFRLSNQSAGVRMQQYCPQLLNRGLYIVDAPGRDEIRVQQRIDCSHV